MMKPAPQVCRGERRPDELQPHRVGTYQRLTTPARAQETEREDLTKEISNEYRRIKDEENKLCRKKTGPRTDGMNRSIQW